MKRFKFIVGFYFRLLVDTFYYFKRYAKYSATLSIDTSQKLGGRIIASAHVIEKGLSFNDFRPFFGVPMLQYLYRMVSKWEELEYDTNLYPYKFGINALCQYYKRHIDLGFDFETLIEKTDEKVAKKMQTLFLNNGVFFPSTSKLKKDKVISESMKDFKSLCYARHSVRNFGSDEISTSLVNEAIEIAMRTPSACNRQSWRLTIVEEKSAIKKILSLQNGNKGFSDKIKCVLLVSADISQYTHANELHGELIDGGMFSMSLIYALQYKGLASCSLNWSVRSHQDEKLRKAFDLPSSVSVIMMIGVGTYPDQFNVASSQRMEPKDIILNRI